MPDKKHALNIFLHIMLGSVLLFKGYDKYQHHHILGGITFLFGAIIMLYVIYLLFARKESKTMHIMIHLFESIASFFTAYIFFEEGADYLPYAFLLAGTGFLIGALVESRRHKSHR